MDFDFVHIDFHHSFDLDYIGCFVDFGHIEHCMDCFHIDFVVVAVEGFRSYFEYYYLIVLELADKDNYYYFDYIHKVHFVDYFPFVAYLNLDYYLYYLKDFELFEQLIYRLLGQ